MAASENRVLVQIVVTPGDGGAGPEVFKPDPYIGATLTVSLKFGSERSPSVTSYWLGLA